MNAKHAIQIYKNHIATLNELVEGVKEEVDHFFKNALKWTEATQHEDENNQLSTLEDQLKNL